VYLVPPTVISDIADRLTGAWESVRLQTRTLGAAEAGPEIAEILRARRALPSQWLPGLARAGWLTGGDGGGRLTQASGDGGSGEVGRGGRRAAHTAHRTRHEAAAG
jgi:hypothetical protein